MRVRFRRDNPVESSGTSLAHNGGNTLATLRHSPRTALASPRISRAGQTELMQKGHGHPGELSVPFHVRLRGHGGREEITHATRTSSGSSDSDQPSDKPSVRESRSAARSRSTGRKVKGRANPSIVAVAMPIMLMEETFPCPRDPGSIARRDAD